LDVLIVITPQDLIASNVVRDLPPKGRRGYSTSHDKVSIWTCPIVGEVGDGDCPGVEEGGMSRGDFVCEGGKASDDCGRSSTSLSMCHCCQGGGGLELVSCYWKCVMSVVGEEEGGCWDEEGLTLDTTPTHGGGKDAEEDNPKESRHVENLWELGLGRWARGE